MKKFQQPDYLVCPFCVNHFVEAEQGKTTCPECSAEFEIDDRLECIFTNKSKIGFPVNGFVCGRCWLMWVKMYPRRGGHFRRWTMSRFGRAAILGRFVTKYQWR